MKKFHSKKHISALNDARTVVFSWMMNVKKMLCTDIMNFGEILTEQEMKKSLCFKPKNEDGSEGSEGP